MNKLTGAVVLLGALLSGTAFAQQTQDHSAHTASSADASLTDGEVRKVDKEAGKVTLRHGAIENLGMPGMTMVFQVQNRSVLDTLKTGDKIRFAADKTAAGFFVTKVIAIE